MHKNYIDALPDQGQTTFTKFEDKVPFAYSCLRYDLKSSQLAFVECPDFDSAREPVVGKMFIVDPDGSARVTRSFPQIYHHKWLWVDNSYNGFDVGNSWRWSRNWLSQLTEPADGSNMQNWIAQLTRNQIKEEEVNAMKKMIKATEVNDSVTNKKIVEVLKSHGIDTTLHMYEMMAEGYDRYSEGPNYTIKFKCPGDWFSYFARALHEKPNAESFAEYFGDDIDELISLIEENPTVDDIAEHAGQYWWGDGDDYVYYLKNLDTNKILYSGDAEPIETEIVDEWNEEE